MVQPEAFLGLSHLSSSTVNVSMGIYKSGLPRSREPAKVGGRKRWERVGQGLACLHPEFLLVLESALHCHLLIEAFFKCPPPSHGPFIHSPALTKPRH